jgi:hypothetical protein
MVRDHIKRVKDTVQVSITRKEPTMLSRVKKILGAAIAACFVAGPVMGDQLNPQGRFIVEHIRDGKVINAVEFPNTVVNSGKNSILDVQFHSATQITAWYIGLMDNASYSSNPVTDTMSSHAGWTEFTGYSESVRQTWGAGSPASQQITNASPAVFSITSSGTLRGIFVASNSTKSGTTGTLWSSALFSSTLSVANGDSVKITYTISL